MTDERRAVWETSERSRTCRHLHRRSVKTRNKACGVPDNSCKWFIPPSAEETSFRELQTERGVLAPFDADYLYCGPRERVYAAMRPSPGTYVTPAFASGPVAIYRLTAPGELDARPFTGC